jgi:hypothetical protein
MYHFIKIKNRINCSLTDLKEAAHPHTPLLEEE